MLPNFDFVQSRRLFSAPRVTKTAVLEIVSECAGFSGRVNPERVWHELQARGFRSSKKAVTMTLHRCSIQGLLTKHKTSRKRVFYSMSLSGMRRLRYKRRVDHQLANAANIEENSFPKMLLKWAKKSALTAIFESSDPVIRAFANFLKNLIFKGASLEEIERFVEIFLESQQMFESNEGSMRSDKAENLLHLILYTRELHERDVINALLLQTTYKNAHTHGPQKELIQKIVESQREFNRILRDFMKQYLGQEVTLSKGRTLSKYASRKMESTSRRASIKALSSSKAPASKDGWARTHSSTDYWQVYPTSMVPVIILEMIRSAEAMIRVQTPYSYLSKGILAEMENKSKQGLEVTLITDNDCSNC